MSEKIELWKVCEDFPQYEVSNKGKVRNIRTGRVLHQYGGKDYQMIGLQKDKRQCYEYIHRLVAKAFVPNPHGYRVVNHKDEVRWNNDAENLEWCTYSYNSNYGTALERKDAATSRPRIKIKCVETGIVYPSMLAAAKAMNLSQVSVWGVVHGKLHSTGGYHFERVTN